jgi:hypothetical protein
VLAANPGYRVERLLLVTGAKEDASVRANAGKRLPLIGRVGVNIIEEGMPRLLAFDASHHHNPIAVDGACREPSKSRTQPGLRFRCGSI